MLAPLVRDQVEAAGLTQLGQGVDVQLVPVVERLVPDEVVQVKGLRAGDGCGQRRGERGLARSAPPVDGDDRRPSLRRADQVKQVRNELIGGTDLPLGDGGFLGLELDGLVGVDPSEAVRGLVLVVAHGGSFQATAHEGQVEDLTMFLAGLRDSADSGETIALVQAHRCRVTRLDESDHGSVPCPP